MPTAEAFSSGRLPCPSIFLDCISFTCCITPTHDLVTGLDLIKREKRNLSGFHGAFATGEEIWYHCKYIFVMRILSYVIWTNCRFVKPRHEMHKFMQFSSVPVSNDYRFCQGNKNNDAHFVRATEIYADTNVTWTQGYTKDTSNCYMMNTKLNIYEGVR